MNWVIRPLHPFLITSTDQSYAQSWRRGGGCTLNRTKNLRIMLPVHCSLLTSSNHVIYDPGDTKEFILITEIECCAIEKSC